MKMKFLFCLSLLIIGLYQSSNGQNQALPEAHCQDISVDLNLDGQARITSEMLDAGSTCANGPCLFALDKETVSCADRDQVTVRLFVIDPVTRRSSFCDAIVNVESFPTPITRCKDLTVSLDPLGQFILQPELIDNGSFHSCSTRISVSPNTFNCSDIGPNPISLTVTDQQNNTTSSQTCILTVEQNVSPIVLCNDLTVPLATNGEVNVSASSLVLNPSDICGTIQSIEFGSNNSANKVFTCADVGENSYEIVVVGSDGTFSTCFSKVTVVPPLPEPRCKNISVSLDKTTGFAFITGEDVLDYTDPNTIPCGILKLNLSKSAFSNVDVGIPQQVTLTVTNYLQSSASCVSNVTINAMECITPIHFFNGSDIGTLTNDFRFLEIDKMNNIWAGTSGSGLYMYDGINWISPGSPANMSGFIIRSMRRNPLNNEVWVGMSKTTPCLGIEGGIWIYENRFLDANGDHYIANVSHLVPTGSDNNSLSSFVVRSLDFNKNTHALWAGCTPSLACSTSTTSSLNLNGGLAFYTGPYNTGFYFGANFFGMREHNGMPPDENEDRMIQAITSSTDGKVYAAVSKSCRNLNCTPGQIVILDGTSLGNLLGTYNINNTNGQLPIDNSTSALAIRALCEDNNKNLWVGGELMKSGKNGISVRTKNAEGEPTWRFLDITTIPYPAGATVNFDAITEGPDGSIYIGTTKGLLKFNSENPFGASSLFNQVGDYRNWNLICFNNTTNHNVGSIRFDKRKNMWLATREGIFCLPDDKEAIVKDVRIDFFNNRFVKVPLGNVLVTAVNENTLDIDAFVNSDGNGKFQKSLDDNLILAQEENGIDPNSVYTLNFLSNNIEIEIHGYQPGDVIENITMPSKIVSQVYELIQDLSNPQQPSQTNPGQTEPRKYHIKNFGQDIILDKPQEGYDLTSIEQSLNNLFEQPIGNSHAAELLETLGSTYLALYSLRECSKDAFELGSILPVPIINFVFMAIEQSKVMDKITTGFLKRSGLQGSLLQLSNRLSRNSVLQNLVRTDRSPILQGLRTIGNLIPGSNIYGRKIREALFIDINSLTMKQTKSRTYLRRTLENFFVGDIEKKRVIRELGIIPKKGIAEAQDNMKSLFLEEVGNPLTIASYELFLYQTQLANIDGIAQDISNFHPPIGNFKNSSENVKNLIDANHAINVLVLNAAQGLLGYQDELDNHDELYTNIIKNPNIEGALLSLLTLHPIGDKIEKAVIFGSNLLAASSTVHALLATDATILVARNLAFNPITLRENSIITNSTINNSSATNQSLVIDLQNAIANYNNKLDQLDQLVSSNQVDLAISEIEELMKLDSALNKNLRFATRRFDALADSARGSLPGFDVSYNEMSVNYANSNLKRELYYLGFVDWIIDTANSNVRDTLIFLATTMKLANQDVLSPIQHLNTLTNNFIINARPLLIDLVVPDVVQSGSIQNVSISYENFGVNQADSLYISIVPSGGFAVSPAEIFIGDVAPGDNGQITFQLTAPSVDTFSVLSVTLNSVNGMEDFYSKLITVNQVCSNVFYADMDGDGFGDRNLFINACSIPGGYVTDSTDCNDNNSDVNQAKVELCNGIDDNCNGEIDEGLVLVYYKDADADGTGDPNDSLNSCSRPEGYVSNRFDCNDENPNINLVITEICNSVDDNCNGHIDEGCGDHIYFSDFDLDGFGDVYHTISTNSFTPPVGFVTDSTDCNDLRNDIHPGATELCNGIDDNCNRTIDEGLSPTTFYRDADGDLFGNTTVTIIACSAPIGYVINNLDCDDTRVKVFPGSPEICNGLDDNCNGSLDEGLNIKSFFQDSDADGFGNANNSVTACIAPIGFVPNNTDCDDNNSTMHPGASEVCNLLDDNCDGVIDEGVKLTFYRDADGDGFGNLNLTTQACISPIGYINNSIDCDDSRILVNPNGTEICNSIDDNCNGVIDENVKTTFYRDADGDGFGNALDTIKACSVPLGYVSNNSDCNDTKSLIHPGASELCDSIDNNCNGLIDEGVTLTFYRDADHDGFGNASITTQACSLPPGFVVDNTDCNDARTASHPGATELCNGMDENCNGAIDEGVKTLFYRDADGDGFGNPDISNLACTSALGFVANNADCNDGNTNIHPGATEICNGIDDDCNGVVDSTICDFDGDGFTIAQGDCNDLNRNINSGVLELCNDIDDNCNGTVDEGCIITFNLKVFIEGFYTSNGLMRPVLFINEMISDSTACDFINLEIRDPLLHSLVLSTQLLLHTDGHASVILPSFLLNHSYYVVIRHRNSLETWSKETVLINSTSMSFDFTSP